MEKQTLSHILIKDAELKVETLNGDNPTVSKIIDDTRKKQEEVLKLKEVNQENLRLVIQL